MARAKSAFYVDPEDLRSELVKYRSTNVVSERLGLYLLKIATRFATTPRFSNYTYRDDFVNDAVYRMLEQIDKINLDHPKCNPFSYFTMTCRRCFFATINKERKHQATKESLRDYIYEQFEGMCDPNVVTQVSSESF